MRYCGGVAALAALVVACGSDGVPGDTSGTPFVPGAPSDTQAFVQGHVDAVAETEDGPQMTIFVSRVPYDRCDSAAMTLGGVEPSAQFPVSASVGTYDSAVAGKTEGGLYAGPATIGITSIEEDRVEGWLDAGAGLAGAFAVDACGYFGQSQVTLEYCLLAPGNLFASPVAISPEGRIATSEDGVTRVFRRQPSTTGCNYDLDPNYGSGGVLDIGRALQLHFDAAERLYAATQSGGGTSGRIVRVVPGGSIDSCLNNSEPQASVTDEPPDEMTVLRDGSVAYGWWGRLGERKIDLTSSALGSQLVECDYGYSTDDNLRYADALSAHADGFLFSREVDGAVHAEVTDLDLVPRLRFGGNETGRGILSLAGHHVGSRCPVGWCLSSSDGVKLYSPQGEYRGFARWSGELGPLTSARDQIEGANEDAFVVLEGDDLLVGVRISGN